MNRQFTWIRQEAPMPRGVYTTAVEESVPIVSPWVKHTGPALWDQGGAHVVFDIVPELEWVVVDVRTNQTMRRVKLDFKEACDFAYDLDCALNRERL